jgi:uncharacterized membrane protein YtjA (UPF0391 family)
MCTGLVFELWDLGIVFGLVALVLWILGITGIIVGLGGIIHIFIVIAVILLVLWLVFRCVGVGRNRGVASGIV